jgi:hypothetical protein
LSLPGSGVDGASASLLYRDIEFKEAVVVLESGPAVVVDGKPGAAIAVPGHQCPGSFMRRQKLGTGNACGPAWPHLSPAELAG